MYFPIVLRKKAKANMSASPLTTTSQLSPWLADGSYLLCSHSLCLYVSTSSYNTQVILT
jgi:hypothetical protein